MRLELLLLTFTVAYTFAGTPPAQDTELELFQLLANKDPELLKKLELLKESAARGDVPDDAKLSVVRTIFAIIFSLLQLNNRIVKV